MSFDPDILTQCRARTGCPLGLIAQASYAETEWLTGAQGERLRSCIDRPDFLAWRAADLPHAVPLLCRALRGPVLGWTPRDGASCATALQWADQVIFEGFEPDIGTQLGR
jgi:hypothetical protein